MLAVPGTVSHISYRPRFCVSWEPSEWHVSAGDGITPDDDNGVAS
jgi:hypothetical protein